jgi:hypothetical protein
LSSAKNQSENNNAVELVSSFLTPVASSKCVRPPKMVITGFKDVDNQSITSGDYILTRSDFQAQLPNIMIADDNDNTSKSNEPESSQKEFNPVPTSPLSKIVVRDLKVSMLSQLSKSNKQSSLSGSSSLSFNNCLSKNMYLKYDTAAN